MVAATLGVMKRLAVLAFLLAGGAGATSLEFGVAYRTPGSGLLDQGWARVGVSDVDLLGGRVSAGVSSRAVDVGFVRGLSLAPVGNATARADVAVTYAGGVRLSSRTTASLGPVALNVGGAYFTAPATDIDPLAAWTPAPTDLRPQGWAADVTARYRVNRTLVAVLGGEFGAQPQGFAGVEGRRDLTRTLPLDPAADPGTEPDTESLGTLSWRAGVRAGTGVLGATGGVTYATGSGLSVAVDALLGPGALGLSGSVSAPDALGEGSTLRLYAAYEPWRTASAPLRAGVEASMPAGPGQLGVTVSGGRSALGAAGFGAKVSFTLPLGQSDVP